MGFFSARRSEDITEQLDHDPALVRVIRSRFYGKQAAAKHRNVAPDPHHPNAPRPSTSQLPASAHYDSHSQRPMDASIPSSSKSTLSPHSITAQPSADPLTITLAQRLDELALANAEGLLNDDEYRLLRQSLFDRFASGSAVPTEVPLVPLTVGNRSREGNNRRPTSPHNRRPSSQYNASVKSPSVQSKRSLTSTVSGILRRASRRKNSQSTEDTRTDSISLFSSTSTSTAFPRLLSKQSSMVSLRTEYSLTTADSYTSRLSKASDYSHSVPASPSTSRSTSRGHKAPPPSAFTGKGISREPRQASNGSGDDFTDDDQLQTAQEIRQEIEAIESEARRLLDAFNGLELSALVRHQRQPGNYGTRTPAPSSSISDIGGRFRAGSVSMSPKGGSVRLARDHDAMSVRSGQSIQTMFSANRAPSMHSKSARTQPGPAPGLSSGSLPRKNSVSSMSVHSRKSGHGSSATSPPLPRTPSRFRLGSTSSVNLSRSANHLPLETVSETDTHQRPHSPTWSGNDSASAMRIDGEGAPLQSADALADEEMADIRRRRAEVTARYDARLEYLRARLRGAELREKLMRS